MKSKAKDKPIVRYRQTVWTEKFSGDKKKIRYKETLVGIITGEAARLLNEASERDEVLMHSYNTNNMEKRELWCTEYFD